MKAVKKFETAGRQTWLAGVGAYDTGREVAADKFDKIFVNSSAFVNSLLAKGQTLEAQFKEKLGARNMIEEKIAALRAKLGMRSESRDQQLETLSSKVDDLIDVVAKLAHQKAVAKPAVKKTTAPKTAAPKATAKKTAVKAPSKAKTKPAAKPTAKPAAKPAATATEKTPAKPAVRKPVATKTAAKPAEDKKD